MGRARALAYLDAHLNREAVAGRIEGLSLDTIGGLLAVLGDPHRAYPVIHVTGTNGKGSVCRMTSALLEVHNLGVGLTTSPHLRDVTERIARNRTPIDDEAFAEAIEAVATAEQLAGVTPSYFEIVTAAAFHWFADVAVDVAVVEVGLLGRYDATNVVTADVAVVTSLGQDHTDGVGDWRRAVAREKAGIIDPESHLVLGPVGADVADEFLAPPARARWQWGDDFGVADDQPAVGGRLVSLYTPNGTVEEVFLPVQGAHQVRNAAVALAAAEAFFGQGIPAELVAEAWADLVLPARGEIVSRRPTVVIDAAHNPEGAAALRALLDDLVVGGRTVWVIGLLDGRDPARILAELGVQAGDVVVACTPTSPRALPAAAVAEAAFGRGAEVEVVHEVPTAVDAAEGLAGEDDLVVVTGSTYVVAPARELFRAR